MYPNDNAFKRTIDTLLRRSGGSVVEKALDEAKKLFDAGARPDSKKVLVLFTDADPTGIHFVSI